MKKYLRDIKEKTSGMTRRETCSYIWSYYWYHIMIFISVIALILLFAAHYGLGNKKPLFTCLMINQGLDEARDLRIRDEFAKRADLPRERVVIDSDYNFSYGQFRLEGTNESSYEKFFFQWRNQEIDAVILSESFYKHCREMGGDFRVLANEMSEGAGNRLQAYMDEGECRAVVLGTDLYTKKITGKEDEKLLLAFPEYGNSSESSLKESRIFLEYACEKLQEGTGGGILEEIIN